ncbi:MAG: hypothetical protein IPI60_15225 [Saprospiraceae bacterium]|nr:hypothetical protein [Saprospiraceae bacterium]
MKFCKIYTLLLLCEFQIQLNAQTNVPYIDFGNSIYPGFNIDQITVTIISALDTSMLKFTSTPAQVEKLNFQNGRMILSESYKTNQLGLYGKHSFDSIFYNNNLVSKIVTYERSKGSRDSWQIMHIIIPAYLEDKLIQEQYFDKDLSLLKNVVYHEYSSTSDMLKYNSTEFETENNIQTLSRKNTHESEKINKVWQNKYSLITNQLNDTLLFTKIDTIFKSLNCEVSRNYKQVNSLNAWFLNPDSLPAIRYIEQIQGKYKSYQYIIYQYNEINNQSIAKNELLLDMTVSKGPWVNEDENFVVEIRKMGNKYLANAQILNKSKTINGFIADYRQLNKRGKGLYVDNGAIYSDVELGKVKFTIENISGNYIMVLEPIDYENAGIRLKSMSNQFNDLSKYDYSVARKYALKKSKPK